VRGRRWDERGRHSHARGASLEPASKSGGLRVPSSHKIPTRKVTLSLQQTIRWQSTRATAVAHSRTYHISTIFIIHLFSSSHLLVFTSSLDTPRHSHPRALSTSIHTAQDPVQPSFLPNKGPVISALNGYRLLSSADRIHIPISSLDSLQTSNPVRHVVSLPLGTHAAAVERGQRARAREPCPHGSLLATTPPSIALTQGAHLTFTIRYAFT